MWCICANSMSFFVNMHACGCAWFTWIQKYNENCYNFTVFIFNKHQRVHASALSSDWLIQKSLYLQVQMTLKTDVYHFDWYNFWTMRLRNISHNFHSTNYIYKFKHLLGFNPLRFCVYRKFLDRVVGVWKYISSNYSYNKNCTIPYFIKLIGDRANFAVSGPTLFCLSKDCINYDYYRFEPTEILKQT